MSDQTPWSPFGALESRLPGRFADLTVDALSTPTTYLVQAHPASRDWRSLLAGGRLLELGPDRALLIGAPDVARIDRALLRQGETPLVDVTEARVWLRLEGPRATQALQMWTTLDFAPTAFPDGKVRGARLGPLSVLIERESAERFVVAGPTSSAEYLLQALLDAAASASADL